MDKILHSHSPYARGVPGRNELSSIVKGRADLWILVQVNCSSITAAGMVYSCKGDEINWGKVQAQGTQAFLQQRNSLSLLQSI